MIAPVFSLSPKRIVLTDSSGRIGRAIYRRLAGDHSVIGIDKSPSSSTQMIGEIDNVALLTSLFRDADAVIHTAALHAPHVGLIPDAEFWRVNVAATECIAKVAQDCGVSRLVFTSTTALYGNVVRPHDCAWIDEDTAPEPHTIYHQTKIAAERSLEACAGPEKLHVRVLRMSRCFPEEAPAMTLYRLHRGVDARDVAAAHALALEDRGPAFRTFVLSGMSPFAPSDCDKLATDAASVLRERAPDLVTAFAARGWPLPRTIDRVYSSDRARTELGWQARFGFEEVLAEFDRESAEVLPPKILR